MVKSTDMIVFFVWTSGSHLMRLSRS